MKRILLIAPPFRKYPYFIKEAIEKNLNYHVHFIAECHYTRTFNILKHLSTRLLRYKVNKELKYELGEIFKDTTKKFDILFVIRGEQISNFTLDYIKQYNPGIKSIFYNWDSFLENPNSLNIFSSFDRVYSFDPKDCHTYSGVLYKPLFYIKDQLKEEQKQVKKNIDILFLGIDHGNRFEVIYRMNIYCKQNNLIFKSFLITSPISYWRKKLFKRKRYRNARKENFVFELIPFDKYNQYLSSTRAVLDVQNELQDGLTMRTFETLGAGKKLITTNVNILNEPFYNESNIQVLNPDDIHLSTSFLNNDFKQDLLLEKHEINNWIKEFFDEN